MYYALILNLFKNVNQLNIMGKKEFIRILFLITKLTRLVHLIYNFIFYSCFTICKLQKISTVVENKHDIFEQFFIIFFNLKNYIQANQ